MTRLLLALLGPLALLVAALAVVAMVVLATGLYAMEWASPAALVLLVPVVLLPFQPRLTGVNRLAVPRVTRRRWSLRLLLAWLPRMLLVAALALLVLAMARPRISHSEHVLESEGLDIMLVIDVSGSMRAEDFQVGNRPINRMEVAKAVVEDFVARRPHDRMGIVVFGEQAFTHVPLTLDHDALRAGLADVEIGLAGARGTAIGTAIGVSARRLHALDAPERVMVLLTDGRNNAGRLGPIEAAQAAGALGIRVYTVGVGQRPTGLRSLLGDEIDEPQLIEIADLTGGKYFRATDTENFQAIYDTIDELETSPAEVRELIDHEELFHRALLPGLLLLLGHLLLGATWLRRGP